LAQRQIEEHFMLRQNWIAWSLNVWLRPRLPFGWPCQRLSGSSQMSSERRAFFASLYVFQLVVRNFCGAGFMCSSGQTPMFRAGEARFTQQSRRLWLVRAGYPCHMQALTTSIYLTHPYIGYLLALEVAPERANEPGDD
jgi:hypothetical protein